ncbi:MAG: D-alanyl-D-alanine carboxypeptidase [Coriobacteriales bacterium]|jgi:D-alanyl-D-alanine carboxypeptidase (penicillin-binding protein 5/6)|nr:D-alanyl-D-alanine carboxypeptidase [Coriobacteriales bacterium]
MRNRTNMNDVSYGERPRGASGAERPRGVAGTERLSRVERLQGAGGTERLIRGLLAFVLVCSLTFVTPASTLTPAFADVRGDDLVAGQPWEQVSPAVTDEPDIVADYAALCTEDGTILWERDGNAPVPMASTTKVMTAIVALELCSPDTPMLVTYGAATTEGSSASLWEGDTTTFRDLLIGMMVPSGNDAAVAISENVAGTEFAFVDLMNAKAAELGMTDTHFSNASGIIDEENYTTARDYLIAVRYAMTQPLFREIVGQQQSTANFGGREETFTSTNHLFDLMEDVTGIKTGFTDAAGYCFVGSASRANIELYVVVFHSSDETQRFFDAQTLLEWGFAHYYAVELINANTTVANVALTSWIDKSVPVNAAAPVAIHIFDYAGPIVQEVEVKDWEGSIVKGDTVGTVVWTQNGEVLATCDVLASTTVAEPGFWEWLSIGWDRFWGGFTGKPAHLDTQVLLPQTFTLSG